MGLLEFLEWTEDLKIQTVLAVYAGYSLKGDHIRPGPTLTPFVEDALDEIEFATGDTSTKWGAIRAKLAKPSILPVARISQLCRSCKLGNRHAFYLMHSFLPIAA
jgi:alpha-N-arabinofuranosidase